MSVNSNDPGWAATAVLVARLIFAALFIMAVTFKLMDINATAAQIAAAGFPASQLLAWLAVVFELALVASFVTGLYFTPAALLAAAYVVFLGVAFHGPDRWAANQNELGFFVDHFTFMAGLFYAAAHGPGKWLTLRRAAAAAA
ncbi:MAG TPA: DoxX family protein [Gammaproteobacteria bacterium]